MQPKHELRVEDSPPPRTLVDASDVRSRLAAIEGAEIVDGVPVEVYRPSGSGRINLSEGIKRHFRENPHKLDLFLSSIVDRAIAGDHNATKLVFERVEGAVAQKLAIGQLSNDQIAELLNVEQPAPTDDDPNP